VGFVAKAFGGLGVTAGLAADRTSMTGMSAGQQFFEADTRKLFVYNGSSWVQDNDYTLDAISVDASGRVRFPYQPMFSAARTSAPGAITGEWNNYNQVACNVGGHLNATTGRFTAPVTGNYYFAASGFGENTYNPVGLSLRINGNSAYSGAWRGYVQIPNQQYAPPNPVIAIWPLTAGQYASVFVDIGAFHSNAAIQFSGFLLG